MNNRSSSKVNPPGLESSVNQGPVSSGISLSVHSYDSSFHSAGLVTESSGRCFFPANSPVASRQADGFCLSVTDTGTRELGVRSHTSHEEIGPNSLLVENYRTQFATPVDSEGVTNLAPYGVHLGSANSSPAMLNAYRSSAISECLRRLPITGMSTNMTANSASSIEYSTDEHCFSLHESSSNDAYRWPAQRYSSLRMRSRRYPLNRTSNSQEWSPTFGRKSIQSCSRAKLPATTIQGCKRAIFMASDSDVCSRENKCLQMDNRQVLSTGTKLHYTHAKDSDCVTSQKLADGGNQTTDIGCDNNMPDAASSSTKNLKLDTSGHQKTASTSSSSSSSPPLAQLTKLSATNRKSNKNINNGPRSLISLAGARRRLGFKRVGLNSLSIQRSEEVLPVEFEKRVVLNSSTTSSLGTDCSYIQ